MIVTMAYDDDLAMSEAEAYDRFMGRYSRPLAVPFADFAGLPLDGRVLDVGCGPGALTAELARRIGPGRVTAVDPSEEFVTALRGHHPGVQVIRAPGEDLPFEGGCFDAALAQLVVNVMADPVGGPPRDGASDAERRRCRRMCVGLHRRRPDRSVLGCRSSARS